MSAKKPAEEHSIAGQQQRQGLNLKVPGICLISAGVILSLIYPIIQDRLMQLLTSLSPDGNITPEGIRKFACSFYSMTLLMVAVGALLRKAHDPAFRDRIARAFLKDSVCHPALVRPSPKFVLVISTLIGIFLIVHIQQYDAHSDLFRILYLEDGVFESLTPVLMVIGAVLLIKAIFHLRAIRSAPDLRVWVAAFYALAAIAFILYAGEEISWGQRIIGWSTPEVFAGNVQNETNLHNFYNSGFPSVYRAMIIVPLFVLPSVLLEFGKRQSRLLKMILPHASMLGLACLIGYVSLIWHGQQELLEELIAVFVLFYSLRAYACARTLRSMAVSGNSVPVDDSRTLVAGR